MSEEVYGIPLNVRYELGKCPEKCCDLDLIIEELKPKKRIERGIHILVDCAHSAVCKYRKEGENDD